MEHRLTDLGTIAAFVGGGNATFTIRNPETGNRFTFRVRASKDTRKFVSVLTGPNNTSDFSYLGCIFDDGRFVVTPKSQIGSDALSAKAFRWMYTRLSTGRSIQPAEFFHEGRCARCGRALTVPESLETGLGPECAKRVNTTYVIPLMLDAPQSATHNGNEGDRSHGKNSCSGVSAL